MQNDKEKIKKEFKKRLYDFTLRLIKFLDKLPDDNLRAKPQAAKRTSPIISTPLSSRLTRVNCG